MTNVMEANCMNSTSNLAIWNVTTDAFQKFGKIGDGHSQTRTAIPQRDVEYVYDTAH